MDALKTFIIAVLSLLAIYILAYTIGSLTIPVIFIALVIAYLSLKRRAKKKHPSSEAMRPDETLSYSNSGSVPGTSVIHSRAERMHKREEKGMQADRQQEMKNKQIQQELEEPNPYQIVHEELIKMQDNASTTEKRQIEEELEALREVEEGINQKSIQEQLKLLAIAIRGVKRATKRLKGRADLRAIKLEKLLTQLKNEYDAISDQKLSAGNGRINSSNGRKQRRRSAAKGNPRKRLRA